MLWTVVIEKHSSGLTITSVIWHSQEYTMMVSDREAKEKTGEPVQKLRMQLTIKSVFKKKGFCHQNAG
jgi:hypothetical protein